MKGRFLFTYVVLATVAIPPSRADSPPNPSSFHMIKANGERTKKSIYIKGNAEYPQYQTADGYCVMHDPMYGDIVYCDYNEKTGEIFPSECKVDDCNPEVMGFEKGIEDDEEVILYKAGAAGKRPRKTRIHRSIKRQKDKKKTSKYLDGAEAGRGLLRGGQQGERKLEAQLMNNLVVLLRFSDHRNRQLPSKQDIEKLFNSIGGHPTLAPTGSVRDVFRFNSYEQFDMVSYVTEWIDLDKPESYYADDYYGMTGKVGEAIREALDQADSSIDWSLFDRDGDGEIDAIAVLHSGYSSEAGAEDCYNPSATAEKRIWSHKWNLDMDWYSKGVTNTLVWKYHISPALWGNCNANIGRIGVIAHETGHFLGCPDLYDGTVGNGVGSYDLMGNSWGFSGSQYYPPMMSPWTKMLLGWLDAEFITQSGSYQLTAAHSSPSAYIIARQNKPTEYFIIENRQRYTKFEVELPQEGLCIYHVDDVSDYSSEGHPDQPGWPNNGNHYRVAVLQADGLYQMEKGTSRGDADDVFHAGGMNEIGPEGIKKDGVTFSRHPSTDWYSQNPIVPSGIRIYNIGTPGHSVSFQVQVGTTGTEISDPTGLGDDELATNTCKEGGQRCAASDECCTRHSCKQTMKRGKPGPMKCKLNKSRRKKKKKRRKMKNKRRRTQLEQAWV